MIPTHMEPLAPFNPHISTFECISEASRVPPVDAQADDWLLEALALEDSSIYVDDRDYSKIVTLTRKAADRNHWKAMLNLASLYLEGHDSPNGEPEALKLVSNAMALGVPAAYDRMGTYYLNGTGVRIDIDRAYAFFQKAAQMGNPQAMVFLGEKLDAGADGLKPGYWGNIPIAVKMLECALAQGFGSAAEELKYMYAIPRAPDGSERGEATQENRNHVLRTLHEGVKGGCKLCADSLFLEFENPMEPERMFVPFIDKARSKRYDVLGDALSFNPERRFPNLDKILPLPPAPLPPWDGQRDSLLAAAMAVVPATETPAQTEASLKKGRFFLDNAYTFHPIDEKTDAMQAPVSAYWQPTAPHEAPEVKAFLQTIGPALYNKGEKFEEISFSDNKEIKPVRGIVWQRVLTVRNNGGTVAPRTAAPMSRIVTRPIPHVQCEAHKPCPITGTWQPWLPPGHPHELAVNQAWRQRWLTAGQPFPDPKRDWMLPLESAELHWHLLEAEEPKH